MPIGMEDTQYYRPTENGFEASIVRRLTAIHQITNDKERGQ